MEDTSLRDWCARAIADRGQNLQRLTPLKVEASHRQFYRLVGASATYVCMYSPPDLENNAQFIALAELFGRRGIPVPRILAEDRERGLFLLDDLGRTHLFDVYGTDQESPALASAIAMLHTLQSITDSGVPPYTTERFAAELDLFNEWFLDAFLGLERNKAAYEDVYASLIAQTQEQPQVCVHRDYHCRNLLFEEGELGVVDFQDALMGPALYDLASLLRDCYHVFAEPQIERWLRTYVADSTLDLDPVAAKRWLDLTAVQRQLKAIGIFARLHVRDGKPSHLPHIIPVLERVLDLARRHRETAALAPCLERVLPDAVHALAVT